MVVGFLAGRSAREGCESFQLGERGCKLGRPRPGVLEVEPRAAAVECQPAGDVHEPVAKALGLGFGKLAVEQQCLGPDDQVVREHHDLQPHFVERKLLERELGQAGVFVVADAVLDSTWACWRWRHSMIAMFSSVWSVRIAWKR